MNSKIQTLPPFTKFIATIGQLPSSYLVSMTYEEQLLWLCNYLENTVIPTLNNNGEAVEELQNLFTQLQNFVNNYFDNLDVQEEINNKLDDLAEDGTLTRLIGEYVQPIQDKFENEINSFEDNINSQINIIDTKVNNATSGSPLVASSTEQMTNTSRIYVNTTDGYWYYYNGSEWIQGGVYQSTGIEDNTIKKQKLELALKNEYDVVNNLVYNYPNEYKERTSYNPSFEKISIDNTGTKINSNTRLTTNFIPVGLGIVFQPSENNIYKCWARCYDKNYNFIGSYFWSATGVVTPGSQASPNPIIIDNIVSVNSDVKFVRLVFANETDSTINEIDYTYTMNNIINKNLSAIYEKINTAEIEFEKGAIRITTGIDNPAYTSHFLRTPYYYEVIPNIKLNYNFFGQNMNVIQYDKDFNYLSNHYSISNVTILPNTKYIRITCVDNLDDEALNNLLNNKFNIDGVLKKIKRNYTINENMNDCQRIWFNIKGTNYYSSSLFKLPSNYNPIGEPIPLIIFVHGSGDYSSINATSMTSNYNELYNYLRDNGYAIWDCDGFGNYLSSGCNTYGTPFNINTYCSGIERFIELFNIDKNRIYMCGKSLGGVQELAMLFQNRIKIHAAGFLAPALSSFHQRFGYTVNERNAIADTMGFSEAPEGLFANSLTIPASQDYQDYLMTNIDKLLIYEPYWKGLNLIKETKFENTFIKGDKQVNMNINDYRNYIDIPIKFWYSMDDININPNIINNLIDTFRNSGSV